MIIEFAGSPRSGKSTTLDTIKDYYIRLGNNVKLYTEGARFCPFPNTSRVSTAFWLANHALNNIIEGKNQFIKSTMIFQDRGLFDALGFLLLLEIEGILDSQNEIHPFTQNKKKEDIFYYMNLFANWGKYVDIVFLFEIEPEIAIKRDIALQIGAGPGLITNLITLDNLQKSYSIIYDKYNGIKFPLIERIKTTNLSQYEIAKKIVNKIESLRGNDEEKD
ncbi:MAG: hypothetical protein Q7U53_13875 [Anaerolineaceae bacterium]|nr:hypothetical protein [Anaerolineaceae bacterium]